MSKRQTRKMLRLMASGEPVELTSPMASVKKLARLAFVAQQFGYEYADVRQSSGRNGALTMLILPDPSPRPAPMPRSPRARTASRTTSPSRRSPTPSRIPTGSPRSTDAETSRNLSSRPGAG
ncbi:hypothetical protein HDC93_006909 [Streptomyces sp. AK010]|nr:hypothetical protein [Streptomyces sp. AK010]